MGNDYYLQHPRTQTFYYVLALLMNISSFGDRQLLGYDKPHKFFKINSVLIVIFAPICIISQVLYLYFNYSDLTFDILGIWFSIFPACCLANVNIISSQLSSYKRIVKNLFTQIHLYNVYEKTKSDFIKNKIINVERYTRYTTFYLIFFLVVNWWGWIIITAVNNYYNKELVLNRTVRLQTCVFLWLPLDYSYNFRNWFVIHFINVHIVGCGIMCIAVFQSLNNIFIYNLIGHIQVLKNMIQTDFEGDLSDDETKKRLVKIIKYHNFITTTFKDVENTFGAYVIANYMQNLLGNSIVLYQLKYGGKENMLLYVTMVLAYTGGPILMSFVLEEIKKQTDDLPEVVYSMPWEKMSVSNQKIVLLILQRVQIIFEFEALGILKAGVKPMISILKTTFSYYVMLETTMAMKS